MVKDTSKKLKVKEAEKVDEVIVKKVEEPKSTTSDTTIKEVIKEPAKMPKKVDKPKAIKSKPKRLIQTGKESESNVLLEESKKVATGQSMGLVFGITIAIAIIAGVSYLAYTKLFKKKKKVNPDEIEIKTDDIKALTGVKKLEN